LSLPKGRSNSGIKNLIPFPKGKSGYNFLEREIKCVVCGEMFLTKGNRSKYCSSSCFEKNRPDKQKKDFICEFCGNPFRRKAPNNKGRFCSRQCSGLWRIANGKKNYFYRAFLFLPHKCDLCGTEEFEVLLVHHINKNKKNNEMSNLQILCSNCHYKIHFGNGKNRHIKIKPIINYLIKEGKYNESYS
jgi:5-methylcytosine-specific restriction endonuclease McrA